MGGQELAEVSCSPLTARSGGSGGSGGSPPANISFYISGCLGPGPGLFSV